MKISEADNLNLNLATEDFLYRIPPSIINSQLYITTQKNQVAQIGPFLHHAWLQHDYLPQF